MPVEFPQPRHMPCPECGASVERAKVDHHVCDPERQVDFNVVQLHPELERFEDELGEYLQSPRGRFELWYAARGRTAA